MKKFILILTLWFNTTINSQTVSYDGFIRGSILVQAGHLASINWLEVPFIQRAELLSNDLNIWQLDFDPSKSFESIKQSILHIKGVINATPELRIKYRNSPNDTFFSLQSHLSIIHAQQAWDIATGGNTLRGDTIVIAVVDDGIDTTHPDLADNFWFNRKEIPWDGKDNDSNGYVDDYRGWNVYNNNPVVSADGERAQHGTPVSGIIGARGNNLKGVSGVMWNVKIMPVVGGDNREAEVIKAYSYVLKQRKLYKSTQGKKGAFVVAVNSSWGADRKKPSDAPLWCAFYDTMGKYGILNIAATSNDPINVDVEGDLPTTCPSDYLISVTNTDQNDAIAGAGYGTISIDLGAPGSKTYSTGSSLATDPAYINFSGTSGAAPIVTGVAGLLFSCACDSFLNLYESNPTLGLKLIKEFILSGTDKSANLNTKTVSGGRVSANGAVYEMKHWCEKSSTIKPISFKNLKLFPNPAAYTLNVAVPPALKNSIIRIHDASGKLVKSEQCDKTLVEIDISTMTNGLYLIKIISGSLNASGYFVVSK